MVPTVLVVGAGMDLVASPSAPQFTPGRAGFVPTRRDPVLSGWRRSNSLEAGNLESSPGGMTAIDSDCPCGMDVEDLPVFKRKRVARVASEAPGLARRDKRPCAATRRLP